MSIKFLTAGESHGKLLNTIIEGIPAGLEISQDYIDYHLKRRQIGYGRGARMKIETDSAEINSGIRHGLTIGSPISLIIRNKDWENWTTVMCPEPVDINSKEVQNKLEEKKIYNVRPGHADLAGYLKYNHDNIRNVLERSSARETATRVAAGSLFRKLLEEFNIKIFSHITRIGAAGNDDYLIPEHYEEAAKLADNSDLRCISNDLEQNMITEIDNAKKSGDTLGGTIQIIATGLPVGLGSYVHWDRKLDASIAQAIMSIPSIKSVEIGLGTKVAITPGSKVHDEIFPKDKSNNYVRHTNNAGGIEGGVSNGMPIIITASMKPIPTLKQPLKSINIHTGEEHIAHYERSDVCAVPAAGVVCESMLAYVLAKAFLEKFGGDSISEIKNNYTNYKNTYQKR